MGDRDYPKPKYPRNYCNCGNCNNGVVIKAGMIYKCINSNRPEKWPEWSEPYHES